MRVLDLGAGRRRAVPGAVAVDSRPESGPDVLHDLDRIPWPFADQSFDAVHARDVLEHLEDIPRAMGEIHRVCRPGARVHIATPHFSCANAYTDPTHRHRLGCFSFDFFTGASAVDYYGGGRFAMVRREIVFRPSLKNVPVRRLANRWPAFYEEHLAWILPAWFLSVELEVVK